MRVLVKELSSRVQPVCSANRLTLLGVNARGFLDLRTTLKFTILAVMLKPFNRAKAPIDEPNLANPRESISPSVLEYDLAFRRAPPYVFLASKYLVLWWWDVIFLTPSCLKSFRHSCSKYLRLKVCLSHCFTMAREFNPSYLILTQADRQKILVFSDSAYSLTAFAPAKPS